MSIQPHEKKIFVLEDNKESLDTYVDFLTKRGFHVKGAQNLEEVERIFQSDASFDLLLLDMLLRNDPRARELNIVGSDVGLRFIGKQSAWPPQVVIMTVYERIDYWRKANEIRDVVFLEKSLIDPDKIITHLRVLLLRRGVSLSNPLCKKAIREVLNDSRSSFQMVANFLLLWIVPELDACLGASFILSLENTESASEAIQDSVAASGLNEEDELKEELAKLVVSASRYAQMKEPAMEPLQLDQRFFAQEALPLDKPESLIFLSSQSAKLFDAEKAASIGDTLKEFLADAAFLSLQVTPDIRLSLLILKDKKITTQSEDPLSLAQLLKKYSLDSLRMTLTYLLEQWNTEQEIKQVQLQELARFCQYVGNETQLITFGFKQEGVVSEKSVYFNWLALLADELNEAGDFLSRLGQESAPPSERLILQEVIQEAWDSLGSLSRKPGSVLLFHGDCRAKVVAAKKEMLFLFSRLLHWLISFYEEEIDMPARLAVRCRLEGLQVEISLESDSIRMHKILRDTMFVPMTQRINYNQLLESKGPKLFLAMYLVKTILEKRYKGNLADRSDELPDEMGHKVVITMPILNG
jgi:CheY-like chemotaxis protein